MRDSQLSQAVPLTIHADGAEMYTGDEFFVWSWSSAFSLYSICKDDLVSRYPICMVPERQMLDDTVLWLRALWSLS